MKKISKEYLYTDIYSKLADLRNLCDEYHQIADTQNTNSDEACNELTEKFLEIMKLTKYFKRMYIDE